MSAFSYEISKDSVAILSFDLPGEKVNKLTSLAMTELDKILDELAVHREIRALVFRSSKAGNFVVGADIAEIRDVNDSTAGEILSRKGQATFAKLEALPFPTVAAIHGPCMGGGLELALSCTYRVISNDPKTALALPEVKLGIIPGFGGTQRLPRLVGLSNSLEMILTGKSIYPEKAKRIGLADEVTYKETLLNVATDMARRAVGKPRPSGVRARRPALISLIESNPITRALIYRQARNTVLKETRGNYPAPIAALEAVKTGLSQGISSGYLNESRLLGTLAPTETSKNLIAVFYLNEALKRDPHPSASLIPNAAVLGAGVMGGGIAQLFAEKGIFVRMKDINVASVASGFKTAASLFKKRRQKKILSFIQARDGLDRITGTTLYDGFSHAEIAVEAVVESMEIKKAVLRDFDRVSKENAIFASNTSSLSITDLATAAVRPERVIGMHFFNPVEKMPLIEVVRGKKTSQETVDAVSTLSRKLGKLPVIVNDGPGFLVNRILMPYLNEAALLLEQGYTIEEIDSALLAFGMPMGAFILLDEIGIDIAHKVADILHKGLGDRVKPSPLLEALYKDGNFGKKNGKGFYLYQGRVRGGTDNAVYTKLTRERKTGERTGTGEIIDRTVLLMIKEAALCLEEKIIEKPELLDAALVFGIGFPPFRGGLLRYADTLGAGLIMKKLESYTISCGVRFDPPLSLREMSKNGTHFYS